MLQPNRQHHCLNRHTAARNGLYSRAESHVLSYPLHSSFSTVTDKPTRHNDPFNITQQYHCFFGSCDGIICLEVNRPVILWNPSIQKFKTLPSLGDYPVAAYGLGYDILIHNYKVVSVLQNGILEPAKIKVHTLGTNSWRITPGDFAVPVTRSLKLTSGTLNWFASNDYSIVSFDLVNESYQIFLPPNYGGEEVDSVILNVLRDCLCIFAHSHTFSSVWMMKEYGNEESWTQLFRVSHMENPFYYRDIIDDQMENPIWISDDDDLVLMKKESISFYSWKINLALCDFKNGAFKIQGIQNINDWIAPQVYI